jgi:DNA invertase Pin-like site-specific DNA recombinase
MAVTTALYLRLSADDDSAGESDSIKNQRDLLRAYVSAVPALSAGEVLEFIDDGWSGVNFERPQVKALLDKARRREVQCVVVKDLSRWGRNYIEVNEYIEQIFPFLGVRFISLNDHYDSDDYKGRTAPMDIAFASLVHDLYCKDLSKKIRQSYMAKAKKGEFVQGAAPYGYVKCAAEKKMEIDCEAAAVVRRIFDLACDGFKPAKIAALLNAGKVDSPVMYQRRLGRKAVGYQAMVSSDGVWTETSIRRIIKDEQYTGVLIFGKTRARTVSSSKRDVVPENEWIKVPGTHESIVSADVYAKARASITSSKKRNTNGMKVPFVGKQKCGYCGHALQFYPSRHSYFLCKGPALNYDMGCSDGKLYLEDLNAAVLATVKTEAAKVLDKRRVLKDAGRQADSHRDALFAECNRLSAQISFLERRRVALYEDFADGSVDKDGYLKAKAAYEEELKGAKTRTVELNSLLEHLSGSREPSGDEPILQRVLDAVEVTDEVLALVDRIVIYDPERIEIRLDFGDTNKVGGPALAG